MNEKRLLLIGNSEEIHMGAHLRRAASALKLDVRFCDHREAYKGPWLVNQFDWRLRDHRPSAMKKFGVKLINICRDFRPKWLLSTGMAPIPEEVLIEIKKMGISCLNYSTDNPWNRANGSGWFRKALPLYDFIFSTRKANLTDFKNIGCPHAHYVPFGFDPELYHPETGTTDEQRRRFSSDVVFIGGADRDRIPYIKALTIAGFQVGLYGGYWDCFRETRSAWRGMADPQTSRLAISTSKIALCLVRRANRDGSCMRTFEVPAVGACMLTEDTGEHREIFGEEGKNVVYFGSMPEMLKKARWLLDHEEERQRLAAAAHQLIVTGKHTYADRLKIMLSLVEAHSK